MSYLFRSTGTVVSITTCQCVLQNLLKKWLTERIHGPNAEYVPSPLFMKLISDHHQNSRISTIDL
jgi:hypothetical protein